MTHKPCPCHASTPDPLALFTVAEAAELLAVSEKTVRRMVTRREIASIRYGRSVRLRRSELGAWLHRHEVSALDLVSR